MARPTLYKHPKFLRVCHMTKSPEPLIVGCLTLLWETGWQSGDPIIGDDLAVELAAKWPGEPGKFFDAVLNAGGRGKTGFIEEVPDQPGIYQIHDFLDHAPDFVFGRAEKEEERKKCKQCEGCGRDFRSPMPDSKFCSNKCRVRVWRTKDSPKGETHVTHCNAPVTHKSARVRYSNVTETHGNVTEHNSNAHVTHMCVTETSPKLTVTSRYVTESFCNGSPAHAHAHALAHDKENTSLGGDTVFCMGDDGEISPPPPKETLSLKNEPIQPELDEVKITAAAKRLVQAYREKITSQSLPGHGITEARYLLMNIVGMTEQKLMTSIDNFSAYLKKAGPDASFPCHAPKFFSDGIWEIYLDGVPSDKKSSPNAKPWALESTQQKINDLVAQTKLNSERKRKPSMPPSETSVPATA